MSKSGRLAIAMAAGTTLATGCTQISPDAFRLSQQEQTFASQLQINTKIDLLWVVDNSASMNTAQGKLRAGFASFATKFLKPTWDIRVAVITTDTFMANSAFSGYLASNARANGYNSAYVTGRLGTWTNPSYKPAMVNLGNGNFTTGIQYRDWLPVWTSNYAKLLPGVHDGPMVSLCYEDNSYFYLGASECRRRDNPNYVDTAGKNHYHTGVANCLNPDTVNGETAVTQCVNTVQNDTIHSGKAILSTQDGSSTQQLINDFIVNASVGSSGSGSERGLSSVVQMITDNEASASTTKFFRAGSLRGIIFVSDEEDQSLSIPTVLPGGFGPGTYSTTVGCPAKSVLKATYSAAACNPADAANCLTYTLSSCVDQSKLIPVSTIKGQIDAFFRTLDGSGVTGDANYFVTSIVPLTGDSIQALQAARAADDAKVGAGGNVSTDRGDRYIELGTLVGNGSLKMDIGAADYGVVLDEIGRAIIQKKSTFILERAPTGTEDMVVKVVHANGASDVVPSSKYSVSGNVLTITDEDFVLSLASTDSISINYQPKTVFTGG